VSERLLCFSDGRVLVAVGADGGVTLPDTTIVLASPGARRVLEDVGRIGEVAYRCAELEADVPAGHELRPLRALHGVLSDGEWALAGRGATLVEWQRSHRYCGRCGSSTARHERERAMVCPSCDTVWYPRLAPAVIALITHGDRALLARHAGLPSGMHSTLAGFVEPGESLEQALAREIAEEVGVGIRDVRYFGSQPWPFPNSLMIAFTAEATSDTLTIDRTELEHAGWYTVNAMPRVPPRISIARALVDWFVTSRGGDPDALDQTS
jgi:NAD+ diphosphatase